MKEKSDLDSTFSQYDQSFVIETNDQGNDIQNENIDIDSDDDSIIDINNNLIPVKRIVNERKNAADNEIAIVGDDNVKAQKLAEAARIANQKLGLAQACRALQDELAKPEDEQDKALIARTFASVKALINDKGRDDLRILLQKAVKVVDENAQYRLSLADAQAFLEADTGIGDCTRSEADIQQSIEELKAHVNDPVFLGQDSLQELEPIVVMARLEQIEAEERALKCVQTRDQLIQEISDVRRGNLPQGNAVEDEQVLAEAPEGQAQLNPEQQAAQRKQEAINQLISKMVKANAYADKLRILSDPNSTALDVVAARQYLDNEEAVVLDKVSYTAVSSSLMSLILPSVYGQLTHPDVQNMIPKAVEVAVKSGVDPKEFVNALIRGANSMSGSRELKLDTLKIILGLDHNKDYDQQMLDINRGKLPAHKAKPYNELLGETLRYVDMLFQKGYPNLSQDALLVKQALCGAGHEDVVKLQHNAMLAHRHLLDKIETKHVAGKKLTAEQEQRKHLAALSAKSFFLTPQLVENLQNAAKEVQFPLQELNYEIAHLALLQYKMLELGLLPAPKMMFTVAEEGGQPVQGQQLQGQQPQNGQPVQGQQPQNGQPVQGQREEWEDSDGDDFDTGWSLQGKDRISSEDWEHHEKVIAARFQRREAMEKESPKMRPRFMQNLDIYNAEIDQKVANGELTIPVAPELPRERNYSLNRGTERLEEQSARQELMNLTQWCQTLQLPDAVVQLVSDTSLIIDSEEAGLEKLNSATESYLIGLTGSEPERRLADKLQKKNALGMDADKLAKNSPEVMANVALNLRIADITGLYKAQDRLVDPESGLAIDGDGIRGRMQEECANFFRNFENNQQVRQFLTQQQEYDAALRRNAEVQARVDGQANDARVMLGMDVITNLKQVTDQLIARDPTVRNMRAERQKLRTLRSNFSFGWWHGRRSQKEARVQVADALTYYLAMRAQFKALNQNDHLFGIVKAEMENARRALAGVDPVKMVKVEGRTDIPSEQMIDDLMVPRLAVINYFDRLDENHRSQADRDKAWLSGEKTELRQLREKQKKLASVIRKTLPEEQKKWLDDLVLSAALKVLIESGKPMTTSLISSEMMTKIRSQLTEWGVPAGDLYDGLINRRLRKMTHSSGRHSDGRIRTSELKKASKDKSMHFEAGKRGLALYKESEEFRNLGDDEKIQKQNLEDTLMPNKIVHNETANSLMTLASQPGQSFTYSRTSGIKFDSGNLLEIRKNNHATAGWFFTKAGFTAFPLSVRVKMMKENSFAIKNTGKGFEVTVKGGWIRGVALGSQLLGVDDIKTTASLTADLGFSKATGAVLNFTNKEDCHKFVQAMMDKQLPEVSELRKLFLKANQIRTVDESGKTFDVTASALNLYLNWDQPPVNINGFEIVGTPRFAFTAGFTLGKGWKTTQEVNSNKTITTSHTEGKFNFQGGVRFEVNAKHKFDGMANWSGNVKDDLDKAKEKTADNVNEEIAKQAEIRARQWYYDNIAKDKLMAKSAGQSFFSIGVNGKWSCDQKIVTDENGLSEESSITVSREWTAKFGTTKIMPGKHKGFLGLIFPGHSWRTFLSDGDMKKLKKKHPDVEPFLEDIAQSVGPNDKVNVVYRISKKSLAEARMLLARYNATFGNGNDQASKRKELMGKYHEIMANKENYVPYKISITSPKGSRAFAQWSPTFVGFELHGNNSLSMSQTKTGYEFDFGDVEE